MLRKYASAHRTQHVECPYKMHPFACAKSPGSPKILVSGFGILRSVSVRSYHGRKYSKYFETYSYRKGLALLGSNMNLAEFIESCRDRHLEELCEFLRIPSVSAKSEHKPDIERAARWVADKLSSAGFKTVQVVPTDLHPLVYAESLEAPGKPTILFYGHYDVQPAEPLDLWTSPAFEPDCPQRQFYSAAAPPTTKARCTSTSRRLEALQHVNGKFPVNIKVLIEGEEEVGSVSLWDYVQKNKEKLKADALVVSDTSMLAKGVPSITYGLRGLNYYQIELTGPAHDLHSECYGGAVPNPLTILTELFAKLHDKNFHALIPGFYDDVAKVSAAERKALNALPWKIKRFRKSRRRPRLRR